MKAATRPAHGFPVRQLFALAARPVLALALLPAASAAAAPHACDLPGTNALRSGSLAKASQAPRLELAGKKDDDDNFDPYGKDDPTNKKWGAAAGLGGNRYGGLRTREDAKSEGRKEGKASDRDEREPRAPRGEDGRN